VQLVPSALQVYIVTTSKEKAIRDNQFIEDLYAGNSDEEPSDTDSVSEPLDDDSNPSFPHVGLTGGLSSESTALLQYSRTRTSVY
jgi:hypothetical protein